MIKKCERCGKPLTEFEIAFHQEAKSPSTVSSKCWVCSGAELEFMDGYTDKPHHKVEIFACLSAIALIAVLFISLFSILGEMAVPVGVIAYFAIGTAV